MEYICQRNGRKMGITRRRVQVYCINGRMPDAVKVSAVWLIPKDAEKPSDPRENNKR